MRVKLSADTLRSLIEERPSSSHRVRCVAGRSQGRGVTSSLKRRLVTLLTCECSCLEVNQVIPKLLQRKRHRAVDSE